MKTNHKESSGISEIRQFYLNLISKDNDAYLDALYIALKALKDINNNELSEQRPGGGYSKSAVLSYSAIKQIERLLENET